jgi:hypothetical protein
MVLVIMATDNKVDRFPKATRLTSERTIAARQLEVSQMMLTAQQETNRLLYALLTERVR